MKIHSFKELFTYLLSEIYAIENHIVADLAKINRIAYSEELKKAITKHLDETKLQVKRLDKIFKMLNIAPLRVDTLGSFKEFAAESERFLRENPASPLVDAAIIVMLQRVEHFEIATYGTLVEFAKVLELDSEIKRQLEDTLKEEAHANETLNKVATGGVFSAGVNAAATRS